MITYVTVGQKYRQEAHPKAGWIHPDGVLLVEGEDNSMRESRHRAFEALGEFWSGIYEEDQVPLNTYPLGITGVITREGEVKRLFPGKIIQK